jgi:hypothetical protein
VALQYSVYRLNWRCSSIGVWSRLPGRTRLATYSTAAEADADLRRRQQNARQRINPFTAGRASEFTSMPFPAFLELIRQLGLTAPTEKYPGWFGWWETVSDAQRSRLWQAFDRLRFYELIAEPPPTLGYAVLELNGVQDGRGTQRLHDEGGIVRGVYRDWERARGCYFPRFVGARKRWLPADDDPLDPETHWRNYARPSKHDIVRVDLESELDKTSAKKQRDINLVVRRVWTAGSDAPQPLQNERVPVCAFGNPASAENRRGELEAAIPAQHDLCDVFAGWFDENDTDAFFDAVKHLNLPAPDTNVPKWWFENREEITREQRQAMWKLFPECRVYEVIGSILYE